MLGASLSFAVVVASSKLLGQAYDTSQQVFFRNLTGVVFIAASLMRRPPEAKKGGKPLLLISRGVIGTFSLYLLFYSISTLGVARAVTYQYTYPLLMALFTLLLYAEKPSRREIAAIVIGIAGVWLIFRPDMNMPVRNHLLGLGNALLTTFAYLAIKELSFYYDSRLIVMSFMLSGILIPVLSFFGGMFFLWEELDFLLGHFRWPENGSDWLLFALLGLSALMGQVMMTNAFALGKVNQVAPIGYTNILFSTLFGILLGEALPETPVVLGMLLIMAGGILITAFPKN